MHINFGEFEAAKKTAVPVDYGTLCAALGAAQASSPTARLAAVAHDRIAFRPMSQAEHAIILFRSERGWRLSPAAMRGNFHAAAATHLVDKAL